MDKSNPLNTNPNTTVSNGIIVRGIVVSNRAKAFARKDGSGTSVLVEHEIAIQPGVVIWARYFDPKADPSVKLEVDRIVAYPKFKEFETVTVRAHKLRTDEHTGQITIRQGELIA